MATSTKYGTSSTAVNVARSGTKNYTNVGNMEGTDDGVIAYATLSSNGESTNWGKVDIDNFSLSNSVIDKVEFEVKAGFTDFIASGYGRVELSPDGGTTWCSAVHALTLSKANLWRALTECTHHTWTTSNIENIELRVYEVATSTIGGNIYVDAVRVTVTYTSCTVGTPVAPTLVQSWIQDVSGKVTITKPANPSGSPSEWQARTTDDVWTSAWTPVGTTTIDHPNVAKNTAYTYDVRFRVVPACTPGLWGSDANITTWDVPGIGNAVNPQQLIDIDRHLYDGGHRTQRSNTPSTGGVPGAPATLHWHLFNNAGGDNFVTERSDELRAVTELFWDSMTCGETVSWKIQWSNIVGHGGKSVAGSALQVICGAEVSRQARYILAYVGRVSRSARYSVMLQNRVSRSIRYSSLILNDRVSRAARYTVFFENRTSRSIRYFIAYEARTSRSARYSVFFENRVSRSVRYSVAYEARVSRSVRYSVFYEDRVSRQARYSVIFDDRVSRSVRYAVTLQNRISRSVRYSVMFDARVSRSVKYAVVFENRVSRSIRYSLFYFARVSRQARYLINYESKVSRQARYSLMLQDRVSRKLRYRTAIEARISRSLRYILRFGGEPFRVTNYGPTTKSEIIDGPITEGLELYGSIVSPVVLIGPTTDSVSIYGSITQKVTVQFKPL